MHFDTLQQEYKVSPCIFLLSIHIDLDRKGESGGINEPPVNRFRPAAL
jgi:hypothetical protein